MSQNQALFALLGTNYGGNGQTTFGLPNLQGRTALGAGVSPAGTTYVVGQSSDQTQVTLTLAQMPIHSHVATFAASGGSSTQVTVNAVQTAATSGTPSANSMFAESGTTNSQPKIYVPSGTAGTQVPLGGVTVTGGGGGGGTVTVQQTGGSTPFSTMPPYQAIQNIICMNGIYPTRQ